MAGDGLRARLPSTSTREASVVLVRRNWIYSFHLTTVLLAYFAMYVHRNVWPLRPHDLYSSLWRPSRGTRSVVKIALAALSCHYSSRIYTSLMIPRRVLFSPHRRSVPADVCPSQSAPYPQNPQIPPSLMRSVLRYPPPYQTDVTSSSHTLG